MKEKKQKRLISFLTIAVIILTVFIVQQKVTETRRYLFNECYYLMINHGFNFDKEDMENRKEYCNDSVDDLLEKIDNAQD